MAGVTGSGYYQTEPSGTNRDDRPAWWPRSRGSDGGPGPPCRSAASPRHPSSRCPACGSVILIPHALHKADPRTSPHAQHRLRTGQSWQCEPTRGEHARLNGGQDLRRQAVEPDVAARSRVTFTRSPSFFMGSLDRLSRRPNDHVFRVDPGDRVRSSASVHTMPRGPLRPYWPCWRFPKGPRRGRAWPGDVSICGWRPRDPGPGQGPPSFPFELGAGRAASRRLDALPPESAGGLTALLGDTRGRSPSGNC